MWTAVRAWIGAMPHAGFRGNAEKSRPICLPERCAVAAMPYLKLQLMSTGRILELHDTVVRLGRDAAATIPFTGDDARVVSTRHAEVRQAGEGWQLADLGSRNGTFLNGRRVQGEAALTAGDEVRLGETGPRLSVLAVSQAAPPDATLPEFQPPQITPPPERRGPLPPEARPYGVTLIATATGKRFEAQGTRIRIGRGKECEIRAVEGSEGIVSRVHAELTVGPGGGLSLRDVAERGPQRRSRAGAAGRPDHAGTRRPRPGRRGDRHGAHEGGRASSGGA